MPGSDRKPRAGSAQIDENLKRVYEDMLNEEVPDRFKALIQQLKQSEKTTDRGGSDEQ
jgi:hypothetical protein